MSLLRRIRNGTTTDNDARVVAGLMRRRVERLLGLVLILLGVALVGFAIGGLFF